MCVAHLHLLHKSQWKKITLQNKMLWLVFHKPHDIVFSIQGDKKQRIYEDIQKIFNCNICLASFSLYRNTTCYIYVKGEKRQNV